MPHQDFERYAKEKSMNGKIADNYRVFFKKNITYKNGDLIVLDFGCGDGKYFPFFKQYFKKKNIYGLEISRIRIDRCKKNGWTNVQKNNVLEKLPFGDNFFDLINFDQVIEHIKADKIDFYISELKRVLKPGGKIILVTPNYPIKRVYDLLNAILKKDIRKIKDDPTHINLFNFKKLSTVFSNFSSIKFLPTGGMIYKFIPINFFSHKIIGIIKK